MVMGDNVPGDGEAEAVAASLSMGRIHPVKAFENTPQLLFGEGGAGIGHRQAAPAALSGEDCRNLTGDIGIFLRVVQQNVRHLFQVLLAALDKEVFLHAAFLLHHINIIIVKCEKFVK